jgi:hypothetical protein
MHSATYYGVDIAKTVFQLYWVDPETNPPKLAFNVQLNDLFST